MDALGGFPARRSALVALIAVLVMFVGATGAYAGGREDEHRCPKDERNEKAGGMHP